MKIIETDVIKLFGKFKHDDWVYFLKTWGVLKISDFADSVEILEKLHKKEFTQKAVILFKSKKLTIRDLHSLDLIYIQKYPRSKLWTVFKLEKIPGTEWQPQDPEMFRQKLEEQLDLFFKSNVDVQVQKQVNWIRISLQEVSNKSKETATVTYIVHHPHTEYLMVANLKATHLHYVMQSMMNVLDCHDAEQLQLKGHHLDSLMQLVINKYSQGSFSEFRLCQVDNNPLLQDTRKRKRKVPLSDDEDLEPQIIFEKKAEKRKRLELVNKTFGPNAQPVLEKVEYKEVLFQNKHIRESLNSLNHLPMMETKFKGAAYAPGMRSDDIFHCTVKFEGPNVIEGIKNLGRCGLAEMPLKDHLGKLPSMAMNTISLRVKQNSDKSFRRSTP